MKIELTDTELALLVKTVEQTSYAGSLAYIVVGLLEKLQKETE